ncbi:MAG TPA: efflux RND transporter periplasmic adaptor subunit [Sphingomonas sp.]|nr:efflux RND transporter periplasmic adaptor subunit [Sphingomonas sp.]
MNTRLPLLSLLLLAGCGGAATEEDKAPEAVAQVRTAPATLGSASDGLTVYGATEAGPGAARAIVVPAEAIIATINAPTGTAVGAGQVIVTLRPSPATRTEIAKASSDAATAAAAYRRALRMRADGLVSDGDVETARGALATASATRNNLGIRGGYAVLRAPGAGTVQGLTAKPGDQLAPGTTIATIGASGDVRARFGVDPVVAQRVRPGQPIRIAVIDGSHAMTVSVVGVDPQIDPATRLASVYARVPGSGLGAGEPLRGTLSVGATSTGVSIPYAALLDDGGRSYVFVVRNGVAKSVDVSPGNSSGDRIQILKGLNPGDRVVTEGGTALEDGMKVAEAGAAK